MPTARPRHQVTETPAVARAIDRAARRWPGEPRSMLLRRLVQVDGETLEQHEQLSVEDRRAAVTSSTGAYPDTFGPDYLGKLREDWPV